MAAGVGKDETSDGFLPGACTRIWGICASAFYILITSPRTRLKTLSHARTFSICIHAERAYTVRVLKPHVPRSGSPPGLGTLRLYTVQKALKVDKNLVVLRRVQQFRSGNRSPVMTGRVGSVE